MYSFDPKINAAAEIFVQSACEYQAGKLGGIFEGVTRDPLDPQVLHTNNEYDLILAQQPEVKGVHFHGALPDAFQAISEIGVDKAYREMDLALTANNYRPPHNDSPEVAALVEAVKQQSIRLAGIACALAEHHPKRRIHQTIEGKQMQGVHYFHPDTGLYTVSASMHGLGTEYVLEPDLTREKRKALAEEPDHHPSNMRYAQPGDIMVYRGQQYTSSKGNGRFKPEQCLWHRSPNIPENRFWIGHSTPSYEEF